MKPGPAPMLDTPEGRVPRSSRLMALAIQFGRMVADGAVRDQAEWAELGRVSRAAMIRVVRPAAEVARQHQPPLVWRDGRIVEVMPDDLPPLPEKAPRKADRS